MGKISRAVDIVRKNGPRTLANKTAEYILKRNIWNRIRKIWHLGFGRPVVTMETPAGKIRFEGDPTWGTLFEIASGEKFEPMLMKSLYETLNEDDIMYDLGARWGIFSLFVRECGLPSENIHNFEADTDHFEILERNVEGDMHLKRAYVSNVDKEDHITLDTYVENHDMPTVIKIDVEGAEMKVIQGAENLLAEKKPELFIEMHPEKIRDMDSSQERIIKELESYNYELAGTNHRSKESTWKPINEMEFPSKGTYLLHAV